MNFNDEIIKHIDTLFRNNVCRGGRTKKGIVTLLSSKFGHSDTNILPKLGEVEIENLNENQDKVKIIYDDFTIIGTITWRLADNKSDFVIVKID